MPTKTLTFVVGTGRSGSTALSRVLNAHPGILSLNELYASIFDSPVLTQAPMDGPAFWKYLSDPNPVFDRMLRSGAPLPEFLYERCPERRYSAETTGVPAISLMMLPHLTDDPDALLDSLEPEVTSWPRRPAPRHWEALFEALAERCGGPEAVVERSGYSLGRVAVLKSLFPRARFVHLHRDGPDCALSMSRHIGFRMIWLVRQIIEPFGVGSPADLTAEQIAALPPDLAALMEERFDPAIVMNRPIPLGCFGQLWSELITDGVARLAEIPEAERLSLSYEALLDAPRTELSKLAAFIGTEPLPDWLDTGSALLDGTGRRGSSRRLPDADRAELRETCAPGMRALGRPVS